MRTSAKTTSWTITSLGALVTLLGQKRFRGLIGAGLTGFGLAHLILGLLDMARPTIRAQE
jgi:hypothetical protein